MELGQLKHFLAVLKHANFSEAANVFGISQQAISASIAKLEEALSVKLFERGRTGAQATVQAHAFAPYVELALNELHKGSLAIIEAKNGDLGELRFGIGQTFAGHIVPQAIAQMNCERPKVQISMTENYAQVLANEVVKGHLDFFVGAPTEKMVSNFELKIEPLFEVSDRVICRSNHPLAGKENVTPEMLDDFPWLFPSAVSDEERAIMRAYSDINLAGPSQVVYSDTIATAQALLTQANYLMVGQVEVLAPLLEAKLLTSISVNFALPKRVGCLGVRREGVLRPCVQRLVELIVSEAAQFNASYS